MKNIKIQNKIALIAVLLLVTTNPLVAVHIETGIEWAFDQIIQNSGFVGFGCLGYLVTLFVYNDRKHGSLKIPKVAKKSGLKYEATKA